MYCGKIVEVGDVYAVFKKTRHPYTKGLLASIPRLMERERRLGEIPGEPPDPYNPPSGCRFHPRCAYAVEICKVEDPDPVEVEEGHLVKCHRAYEIT
jgi:oligopeptide/dipeptide ABC transporter ATP-binding protein